ncbi:unnamed protein product [Cunninghamella echinulata]
MQFVPHYFLLLLVVIKTTYAIIGGKEVTTIGKYPFMVGIFSNVIDGEIFKCGGVLRDINTIITSGHCVYGETITTLTIKYGSLDRNQLSPVNKVLSIKTHPLFDPESMAFSFLYDVAILKVDSEIKETDTVKYVPLATTEPLSRYNTMVSIAGWGRTSKDDDVLPTMLQTIDLPLLSQCSNTTKTDTNIQQCMGGDRIGACYGDQGGPVIYNNQLVGILSQGFCEPPDGQNIYTSTIEARDFLNS